MDFMVRGGSSPLGRTGKAPQRAAFFAARERPNSPASTMDMSLSRGVEPSLPPSIGPGYVPVQARAPVGFCRVRIEETFTVARPPEVVFDYVTDPSNLADWQTAHTTTEQLTEGPPRLGSRFRERLKPPLSREFEQVTEFTEFVRPERLHVHVVE